MSNTIKVEDLPVKEIFADPDFNCRGTITPLSVMGLRESIAANGLKQAIVVQPYDKPPYRWKVVMGHRRYEACRLLKWATIPASVESGLSDTQARLMNLIENLERADLTIMQEAKALEKFFVIGISQDEVAKMLGQSRGWVQVRATALKLDPLIQAEIDAGFIKQHQIIQLYSIPSKSAQFEAVREIKDRKLRGDKEPVKIKPDRVVKAHEKKVRNQTEIFAMQDRIREMVGNNLGTRALGWAAGLISDNELMEDVVAGVDAMVG